MNDISLDEEKGQPPKSKNNKKTNGFLTRTNIIIGLIILAAVIILTIIIVLAVTLSNKNKKTEDYNVNDRVDCLPWMRTNNLITIENECNKLSYSCIFNPVYSSDNRFVAPACFYNKNNLKLKIVNQQDTKFGISYLLADQIESNFLRLEFEFLDDQTIRFKVIFWLIKIFNYSFFIILLFF
jgi:hypothetical protein